MAMLRYEFEKLTTDNLKTLIRVALELISEAAPFPDTRQIISRINEKTVAEFNHQDLQATLINLMKLVLYWDAHKDQHGHFKFVEKNIVNEMLNVNIKDIEDMALDQHFRYQP
jgi:hypothetical protein